MEFASKSKRMIQSVHISKDLFVRINNYDKEALYVLFGARSEDKVNIKGFIPCLTPNDFEATISEVAATGSILGWMKIVADEEDLHDKVHDLFSRYATGLLTHYVEEYYTHSIKKRGEPSEMKAAVVDGLMALGNEPYGILGIAVSKGPFALDKRNVYRTNVVGHVYNLDRSEAEKIVAAVRKSYLQPVTVEEKESDSEASMSQPMDFHAAGPALNAKEQLAQLQRSKSDPKLSTGGNAPPLRRGNTQPILVDLEDDSGSTGNRPKRKRADSGPLAKRSAPKRQEAKPVVVMILPGLSNKFNSALDQPLIPSGAEKAQMAPQHFAQAMYVRRALIEQQEDDIQRQLKENQMLAEKVESTAQRVLSLRLADQVLADAISFIREQKQAQKEQEVERQQKQVAEETRNELKVLRDERNKRQEEEKRRQAADFFGVHPGFGASKEEKKEHKEEENSDDEEEKRRKQLEKRREKGQNLDAIFQVGTRSADDEDTVDEQPPNGTQAQPSGEGAAQAEAPNGTADEEKKPEIATQPMEVDLAGSGLCIPEPNQQEEDVDIGDAMAVDEPKPDSQPPTNPPKEQLAPAGDKEAVC